MAACRLASKGKTMADSGYDAEVSGIQAFLSMQHDKGDATPLSPGQVSWCSIFSMFWHALTKLTERTGKLCVENGLKNWKNKKTENKRIKKKLEEKKIYRKKLKFFSLASTRLIAVYAAWISTLWDWFGYAWQSSLIRLGISRQSVSQSKTKTNGLIWPLDHTRATVLEAVCVFLFRVLIGSLWYFLCSDWPLSLVLVSWPCH